MRGFAPVVVVVGSLLALAGGTTAAAPQGRIVFAASDVATAWGEIYAVTPGAATIDLSKSPAADLDPVVSPNGARVAFVSVRGGRARVFVVGTDGHGRRPVSPPLFRAPPTIGVEPQIAWSPNGTQVAVDLSTSRSLYVATLAGGWRRVARGTSGGVPEWSADSRRLAYGLKTGLVAVSDAATAKRVWTRAGLAGTWSRDGRLAVEENSFTIVVYDAAGRRLARFEGDGAAWSPNGTTLASEVGGRLQLRRLGVGSPVRTTRLGTRFEWLTNTRIRVQTENGWRGYDVARRRPVALPAAAARPLSVASPNGQKFAFIRWASHAASLVLGTHVVATVATCSDDLPFLAVGFVPRTSTVVYQSGCPLPSADLYSIAPDGTARQRLTATPQHEFDPALSPDGSRVAFDQQAIADRCEGCAQSLWVTPATQLTFPKDIDPAPFDADPSWSPDGSTLVFDRSGADAPLELYTIAAAGGTAKDLHVAGIHPAWGPALIAFLPWNAKTPAIETLDPATGAVRTVASGKNMNVGALAWSLDGRLAYLGYAANNHAHITVAGSQAKPIDLTALLRNGGRIVDLAWSPDGGRFAFSASDANGIAEIYTIRVDGTGLTQVTKDAGVDVFDGGISWR